MPYLFSLFVLLAVTDALAASFNPANNTDLINAINTANTNNENDTIFLNSNTFTFLVPHVVPADGNNALPSILADNNIL